MRQLVTALGIALFAVLLTNSSLPRLAMFERLELATLDYRFRLRGPLPVDSSRIVIVEIADESFQSVPERFPWPRSHYARLLTNLYNAGASVVAFDLIFGDPDMYSPRNDSLFAQTLRETRIGVLAGIRDQDSPRFTLVQTDRFHGNIFYRVDSALGLVNIRPDNDGIYRTYPVGFLIDTSESAGVTVPTFGFAVLNKYLGLPPGTVPEMHGDDLVYAGRTIPAIDRSSLLINFYGPSGTFPHVKFQDVIDDETFLTTEERETGEQINTFSDPEYGYLHDGTFRNKIVLVGVTVPEYKDLFPVAVGHGSQRGDNLMYGVEIHANLVETVLRSEFLHTQSSFAEALMVIGLCLLSFFGTSFLRSIRTGRTLLVELLAAGGALVLLAAYAAGAVVLFTASRYVVTVTPALLAIALGAIGSTTYHFIAERKQRLLIKSMFSTYVHPQLVEELVNDPAKLVLGGKREELTVLFSDLEGFTSLSQDLEPERLVALLNEYLSVMSDIVFKNRGTLDKYEGDAIMAFWGAPIPQPDHALLACRTALEMRDALADLNRKWIDEKKPHLNMRIGINTGMMVVGNMGSAGKFAYTVIGDSVNLASRLEGANKEYRTTIMAGERTFELVRDRIFGRRLDRIAVKGRTHPVTIYELLQTQEAGIDPARAAMVERYEEGMKQYLERKFPEAAHIFAEVLASSPDDGPARLFLTRAKEYATAPPPPDWNGVYVMKFK